MDVLNTQKPSYVVTVLGRLRLRIRRYHCVNLQYLIHYMFHVCCLLLLVLIMYHRNLYGPRSSCLRSTRTLNKYVYDIYGTWEFLLMYRPRGSCLRCTRTLSLLRLSPSAQTTAGRPRSYICPICRLLLFLYY